MAKRKLNYNEIKIFVESLGYKLNEKIYINSQTKMSFTCPNGHSYQTNYSEFKRRKYRGCPECKSNKKLTYKELENFFNTYGFKLLKGEYKNCFSKLKIRCPNGHVNESSYNRFKNCINKGGYGCPDCFNIHKRGKSRQHSYDFVKNVIESVGYKLLSTEYKGVDSEIEIECGYKHKYFTTFYRFKAGNRCPFCYGNFKKTTEQFRKDVYKLVGNEYEVLGEYKNIETPILFLHRECNDIFLMRPSSFLKKGSRCTKCKFNSKGKQQIIHYLKGKNIKYTDEERFNECRNKNPLPFDIFVDNKFLIEYDGIQHFEENKHFGGIKGFSLRKQHDQIKNEFCIKHNIPLIRIPYWDYENIEDILNNCLSYFNITHKKDSNIELVHKYLVNHKNWTHQDYINLHKQAN